MHNIDRLYEAVAEKGHVCVGLDTSPGYVPPSARRGSDAESVLAFNRAVIDATADIAACFKVQIAYYEALGRAGLESYAKTLAYIRQKKSLVIADIKRGDIADTALQYAKAHFEGDFEADFVTLSPYMGMDSIEPWLNYAESKGAFVLLRTSNKGMKDFQNLETKETESKNTETKEPKGMRLYHAVGDRLAALEQRGKYGYGAFGAVVGADPKSGAEREEAAAIRKRYNSLFFLIPGYGAQGGAAEDAALLLQEGNGGVVNASRSILKAWTEKASLTFPEAAREAAITMRDMILKAAGKA
jgi:orotidine-5'-phosphate decarboxylase